MSTTPEAFYVHDCSGPSTDSTCTDTHSDQDVFALHLLQRNPRLELIRVVISGIGVIGKFDLALHGAAQLLHVRPLGLLLRYTKLIDLLYHLPNSRKH